MPFAKWSLHKAFICVSSRDRLCRMRESESLSLTEFADHLRSLSMVSVRLVLAKAEAERTGWVMQAAAMKVAPDVPPTGWTLYHYGPIAFVADSMAGAVIAEWFVGHKGEISGLQFDVPEFQERVRAERLPSHERYRFFAGLWQPHTHFELSPKASRFEPRGEKDPLIRDGCPSYPTLGEAAYHLLFDVELDRSSDKKFPSSPFVLQVAHTEAWIERVEQHPSSLIVNVEGDAVEGVRLEVTGSKGVRFDQKLAGPGDVRLEMPDGLPPRL